MGSRLTILKRFAKSVLGVLRRVGVPLYSDKYNRAFTLHQHVVLLCCRKLLKLSYRDFRKYLEELGGFVEFLGLSRLPHFTTPCKAALRIKKDWLEKAYVVCAGRGRIRVGVDSTGMSLNHTTHYYQKRLEYFQSRKGHGRLRKLRVRKHQYLNLAVDLDRQNILAIHTQRGKQSDNRKMIPTLEKVKKLFPQITSVDADKGYDAEYNFRYVTEQMNAIPYIRIRNENTPVHRTRGQYRKKIKQELKSKPGRKRKNWRNKCESTIASLKKKFGEHLTAKKHTTQRQEMECTPKSAQVEQQHFMLLVLSCAIGRW